MFKYKLTKPISLAIGVFSYYLLATIPTKAQITPDGTVPTRVETTDNQNFTITGGERAGNNLFHSFEKFSVPKGGEAYFNNASTIENIFSRVTGDYSSNIDGLIKTNPSANLFLINPNGIIFGENAQLDVGGSFLATTADSINFSDSQFSATDTQTEPLLSINVPIGLQFGERPGRIVNRAIEIGSDRLPNRLAVKLGKTLALVGGDVEIDGGGLRAPGGRIELGSVGSFSFVDLALIDEGLVLGYEQVQEFQNIRLLSGAFVDTTDLSENLPSGNIQLYGRAIKITDSILGGTNYATTSGGTLLIKAAESFSINSSVLITSTFSSGTAGHIEIETKQLLVSDGLGISTSSNDEGKGGNLTINAEDSVEVIGNNFLTLLSTRANQNGNAGNINITTGKLILKDGGQISSSTFLEGDGGNVTVYASESVEISGQGEGFNEESSGLFAQTTRRSVPATGDGGNITVNTRSLSIRDGGRISVGAVDGSEGAAGSLTINAQDITLDRGSLAAETRAGSQGNITINNADTLLLGNNSEITTNATESATGGNITIDSEGIALLDNSKITANAVEGRGGNIVITTQGLFQEPGSEITADSELDIDGTITINSPDVDPTSGIIELPNVPIDADAILAQNLCKFEDNKIAKGSSFIITGRGGLTPTSEESLGNLDRVVNWASRDDIQLSNNGVVGVRQRSEGDTPEKGYPVIQQSQGWVKTSDGSVWLVANSPETILQNSGISHPDCGAL
ncbi:MAG: filamentous hemagglutinin N-terminal domain-containing protein [Xenococcaceae cyanobacterium MO_207.B15]|nr:filamentous hemagglutinin N-terminal domain-containing protein [Xenococcaceae cyanobacterium MO_207.B15]